jgi:Ca-activated chloride channel homolog
VLADFHFLRPVWLLLPLASLLLLLVRSRLRDDRVSAWTPWVDEHLARWVLVPSDEARSRGGRLREAAVPLVICMLGLACAGPAWERRAQPQSVSGHSLVVALDLSRSMLAADLRPSRLVRARFKLADLLASRGTSQTALVVYAADAFMVTPLTGDIETLRLQLPVLEPTLMPVQGSRADLAYERGVALLKESGFPQGDVLLVTDGIESSTAERLLESCRREGPALWILAAATAEGAPVPGLSAGESAAHGVVVSRLDLAGLSALARGCGGEAVALTNDNADIERLQRTLELQALKASARDAEIEALEWIDRGPWLLLLLLPFLAHFTRSHALAVVLCIGLAGQTSRVEAFELWQLWRHPDEQGHALLQQGQAEAAMEVFADPAWKAWAAAEAGKLEDTATLLSQQQDAESLYNRGTALAKLGRFPEALDVLEQAIDADPDHADARFNRDLIARLLEQQQPPSQDESGSPEDGEDSTDGESREGEQDKPGEAAEPRPESSDDPADEAGESGSEDGSAAPEESPDDAPPEAGDPRNGEINDSSDESAQATEQWLTKIPDDPGGLLRNKFLYQSQRRRDAAPSSPENPW